MTGRSLDDLGDLQAAVMEVVWELGEATVGQVRDRLTGEKELAYTTLGHRVIVSPSARVKSITSSDIVLGCLGDLLGYLGLDSSRFQRNFDRNERAIAAWIEEGSLAALLIVLCGIGPVIWMVRHADGVLARPSAGLALPAAA